MRSSTSQTDLLNEPLEGCAVVLLGTFDVTVFTPSSIHDRLGIPKGDMDVTLMVPGEVVGIEFPFVEMTAETGKIQIRTKISAPIPEKTRDLAGLVLEQTNLLVSALGVNHYLHQPVDDAKYFMREIQNRFVRQGIFDLGLEIQQVTTLGLLYPLSADQSKSLHLVVEGSKRLRAGIFVAVNEHHGFPQSDKAIIGVSGREVSDVLPDVWSLAERHAASVFAQIKNISKPLS